MKRWLLPLAWSVAGASFLALSAAATDALRVRRSTVYMVVHSHYALSMVCAFGAFAAIYLVLARAWQTRWFWVAAIGHLLTMCAGALLIVFPAWAVGVPDAAAATDPLAAIATLNHVSSIGYGLTLAGLALFALALAVSAAGWARRAPSRTV